MFRTGLIIICCLSFYSHAATLTGQAEGASEDIAKFKALKSLMQQLDVQAYQDSNLALLAVENLPTEVIAELATLPEPLSGLKYTSLKGANNFIATASYDTAEHLTSLNSQILRLQKRLVALQADIDELSLENLNLLIQLDRQVQSNYRLATALRKINGDQQTLSEIQLTAQQRDKANSRIDGLSQLQANSSLGEQSSAAKDIYSALAEQISVTVKSKSVSDNQLVNGTASQRFSQLTETLTNQTLTGVRITEAQEQGTAKYVGTLYPRQSAMQTQRKVSEAYNKLTQNLAKSYDSDLDRNIDHLRRFQHYQGLVNEYNTLISLYGGANTEGVASALSQYFQTLEIQMKQISDSELKLSDMAKVLSYYNGEKNPLSLCPILPQPNISLQNTAILAQNIVQLSPEADSIGRVLRLSIKPSKQVLAEIVEPQGQVVYSQTFKLDPAEFSQSVNKLADSIVTLTDTSEKTQLSPDQLFDVLLQEVDLGDSVKIKVQCIPDVNEPLQKQAVSLLADNLIQVDINYLFDSTTISGMPEPIEFCRARVNGKAYNLLSNKTASLFADAKQAPYTEQESAIAQASSKAFKKLKRRLEKNLKNNSN
jgi:hypothetical protein